jgi:hypothetical protein
MKKHVRGCTGKARHRSYETAALALARVKRDIRGPLEVYKCKFCDGWHTGTPDIKARMTKRNKHHDR